MNRSTSERSIVQRAAGQWPLLSVLVLMAASMLILTTGHWRRGSFTLGCAVLLAGLLRAVLPTRTAGLLAVRSRVIDTALLVVAGVALLALTMVVPHSHPGQ